MTPTTLPADALGGGLLDEGVAVRFIRTERAWHGPTGIVTRVFKGAHTCLVTSHDGEADGNGEVWTKDLALDLTHWTARAQVCRVVAAGQKCTHVWREFGYAVIRCEACSVAVPREGFQCRGCGGMPEQFVPCHGSVCAACAAKGVKDDHYPGVLKPTMPDKWVRKPAPAWHLLPISEGGQLPDELAHFAPALLAGHVRLVEAGKVGIRGVLGEWDTTRLCYGNPRPPGADEYGNIDTPVRNQLCGWRRIGPWRVIEAGPHGWSVDVQPQFKGGTLVGDHHVRGPETGDAGKRLADLAALSAGFALASGPDLVMPEGA